MATVQKLLLSGSIAGRPISITTTSTPGTPLHTTTTNSSSIDEVWLYSSYIGTGTPTVTVEWGGTGNGDRISAGLTGSVGLYLMVPGLIMSASGSTASTIRAYASTGSGVTITGYVNRYTP